MADNCSPLCKDRGETDRERRRWLQPSRAERTIQPDFLTFGSTAPLEKQCSPYLAKALPTIHPFTVSTLSLVYSLYSNRVQLLNWQGVIKMLWPWVKGWKVLNWQHILSFGWNWKILWSKWFFTTLSASSIPFPATTHTVRLQKCPSSMYFSCLELKMPQIPAGKNKKQFVH